MLTLRRIILILLYLLAIVCFWIVSGLNFWQNLIWIVVLTGAMVVIALFFRFSANRIAGVKVSKILWIVARSFITFFPLILVISILLLSSNQNSLVTNLRYISDNQYLLNNILLIFIAASYAIVWIGLVFYFLEVWENRGSYRGNDKRVKALQLGVIFTVVALLFVSLFYLFSFGFSFFYQLFNLYTVVIINKVLTIIIFTCFLITDSMLYFSYRLQLNEYQGEDQEHKALLSDQKKFSTDSIFLINIPALLLALFAFLFAEFIKITPVFKSLVDQKRHYIQIPSSLNQDIFDLFLNGFEAGVIISTIVFSQIIFNVLKIKIDFRNERRNSGALTPIATPARATTQETHPEINPS